MTDSKVISLRWSLLLEASRNEAIATQSLFKAKDSPMDTKRTEDVLVGTLELAVMDTNLEDTAHTEGFLGEIPFIAVGISRVGISLVGIVLVGTILVGIIAAFS